MCQWREVTGHRVTLECKIAEELPFYSVIDLTVSSTYLDTEYKTKLIVKKVKHLQKKFVRFQLIKQ